MSSRKLGPQRPFSHRTPTSNQKNLNATISSGSRGSSRSKVSLNSTTVFPHMSINAVPPLDNFEADYDLTYNEYLQNVVKKLILQKSISTKRAECNDELECLRESVAKLKDAEEKLIEEIENIDISRGLTKSLDELKVVIQESEQTLNKNVLRQVNYFVEVLTAAINKLYLHNVHPLRSKEEYDQFNALIDSTSAVLEKTLNLAGDIKGVHKFAGCLSENSIKYQEINNKSKAISRLQDSIAMSTLEKTSNLLAACKENL